MSAAKTNKTNKKKMTFEQNIQALAKIVEKLEGGDLPLAESIQMFEDGMKLAKSSQAQLDEAERRVEEVLSVDEEGTAQTKPFIER